MAKKAKKAKAAKTAGTSASAKTAKTAKKAKKAKKAKAKKASDRSTIPPDDPNYPEYDITFAGDVVRDDQNEIPPGGRFKVSGPHTMFLFVQRTRTKLRIDFTHEATDATPNLLATVTEE